MPSPRFDHLRDDEAGAETRGQASNGRPLCETSAPAAPDSPAFAARCGRASRAAQRRLDRKWAVHICASPLGTIGVPRSLRQGRSRRPQLPGRKPGGMQRAPSSLESLHVQATALIVAAGRGTRAGGAGGGSQSNTRRSVGPAARPYPARRCLAPALDPILVVIGPEDGNSTPQPPPPLGSGWRLRPRGERRGGSRSSTGCWRSRLAARARAHPRCGAPVSRCRGHRPASLPRS